MPEGYEGVVVELGPGTGVFTHAILNKLGKNGRLVAFESHPPFVDYLRKKILDPRLTVIEGFAQTAPQALERASIRGVEYVISCLPLANIEKPEREKILDAIHNVLAPNGVYMQVQYFPLSFLALRRKFKNVRIAHYELRNIPPAFVYECRKN